MPSDVQRLLIPETTPLQPLPVLLILDCLAAGGAQTFALDLATTIDSARVSLTVCALRTKDPQIAEVYRAAGVDLVELGMFKGNPLAVLRLYKLIKRRGIKVVHTMLFASDTYGRIAAFSAGVEGVIVHKLANDGMWKRWYHVAIDRWLTGKTDLVMANAEAVRRYYVDREHTPLSKTVIVHHPMNKERLMTVVPVDLRAELGLHRQCRLVGVMGRLAEQKDLVTLLRAAARLRGGGDNEVCFVVGGTGPLLGTLRSLAVTMGIADIVRFLGRRSDAAGVIAGLDVFVNCSRYEGLPVTLLEAMAMGTPVVASAVDGNLEVARHEETALVFEPGDDEALACRLERYRREPELAGRLSANAARYVGENYSISKTARQLEDIYRTLAAER